MHQTKKQGSTFFPRGWAYFPSKPQNTGGVGGWFANRKPQTAGGLGGCVQLELELEPRLCLCLVLELERRKAS